ncbi:MAG TPA: TolC family protein [Candidatus Binataceae bacterium]|nr:TolC family protein [Candidatus Binataceae bacterium]
MRRRLLAIILGSAVVIASTAMAAEVPIHQGQELTLEQAIAIALTLHPRILASASDLDAAHEGVGIAEANLLPQAYGIGEYLRGTDNAIGDTAFIGGYEFPRLPGTPHLHSEEAAQSFSTHDNYLTGLSIRQYLFDFGRVRGLIHEQQDEAAAAKARYDLARLNLILEVSQRYFEVLAARANVKVFEKSVEQRQEHLHEAQLMSQAQLKPQIDVYTTQAQLSRSQLDLIKAQNSSADAKVALDNAMGLSENAIDYRMAGELSWNPISNTLAQLLGDAIELRPDLKMMTDEAEAAGAEVKIHRSDYFPTVQGAGDYETMGTGTPASNNFDVGVVVTWPIFNGFKTEHQVAQARYKQDEIKHEIEDLRQQIVLQVTRAFLDWQASVAAITKAQSVLDASKEELNLAEHRYRNGLGNIVELEDAQTRFTADSSNYVDALYGYAVTKAAVDHATAHSLVDVQRAAH